MIAKIYMANIEYRAVLRGRGHNYQNIYYFGKPKKDFFGDPFIKHYDYAIPGEITFIGSIICFESVFFPPQNLENSNILHSIILKLDLKKLKKISKNYSKDIHSGEIHMNYLSLHFIPHGIFLEENLKKLIFTIRAKEKWELVSMHNKINIAKEEKETGAEVGILKYLKKLI